RPPAAGGADGVLEAVVRIPAVRAAFCTVRSLGTSARLLSMPNWRTSWRRREVGADLAPPSHGVASPARRVGSPGRHFVSPPAGGVSPSFFGATPGRFFMMPSAGVSVYSLVAASRGGDMGSPVAGG